MPDSIGQNRPIAGILTRLTAVFSLAIMFTFVKLAGENGVYVIESLFLPATSSFAASVFTYLAQSGRMEGSHFIQTQVTVSSSIFRCNCNGFKFLGLPIITPR